MNRVLVRNAKRLYSTAMTARGWARYAVERSPRPRQPYVDVKPDLMTRVAGNHGSAARLRHVPDEKPGPTIKSAGVARKMSKKIKKPRIAPVAVAGEPHHLHVGAVGGKRHATSEASSLGLC